MSRVTFQALAASASAAVTLAVGQYNDVLAEGRDCALDLPYGHAVLAAGLAAT